MYDKIDLYISDSNVIERVDAAIKNNSAFTHIGNYTEFKYLLTNGKAHAHEHGLTVQITEKTKGDLIAPPMLHVSGSIRKWFYGALSTDDLTRNDTLCALTQIAEALGLTYDEFREFPISAVEVGLNLDLGELRCEEIKSRICSFKDARYKCTDAEGYKRFKTGKLSGKVYDKLNEIRKTCTRMPDKHGIDRFEYQNRGKNVLRVEIKALGGANAVSKYFCVKTVGDMVNGFYRVLCLWLRYAKQFDFKGTYLLPFRPEKRSAKEFTDYIMCRGLHDIGEVEIEKMLDQLPVQARRDARNTVRARRLKMPDAINIRQRFHQMATQQFADQCRKSLHQYADATG